jgi:hypothetical protein
MTILARTSVMNVDVRIVMTDLYNSGFIVHSESLTSAL